MSNWAYRMFESEKRTYPRFDLSDIPWVRGQLDVFSPGTERLSNISKGGCGFVSPDLFDEERFDDILVRPKDRVILKFELANLLGHKSVEIQGNIRHRCKTIIDAEPMLYYGIEFLPYERPRVEPILEAIRSYSHQIRMTESE